jgi:hypothetical protein
MINLVIFYFWSMLTLLFYPLQGIFYSLMIVYIYKKCNISAYKSMSCIFLKLLVILFYLLDMNLIIAGIIILLLVMVCITNMCNNNILAKYDNNFMINILWNGYRFIISFLMYIYAPIYKYFDIGINKLVNFLTSPKSNKSINNKGISEIEKLESIFKNINEQIPFTNTNTNTNTTNTNTTNTNTTNTNTNANTNITNTTNTTNTNTKNSINNKTGFNNNFKSKINRHNVDKQTKELINMFEQLSSILKDQNL